MRNFTASRAGCAHLQLGVEEGPHRAQEPRLRELAVEGQIRLHLRFHRGPSLDVDAVEGEDGRGDALLDDGRELQLVAGRASCTVSVQDAAPNVKSS
jgi:hypothetical protein